MIAKHPYKETVVPHLLATLIYLSQNYSYYTRGDRSPLISQNYNSLRRSRAQPCPSHLETTTLSWIV